MDCTHLWFRNKLWLLFSVWKERFGFLLCTVIKKGIYIYNIWYVYCPRCPLYVTTNSQIETGKIVIIHKSLIMFWIDFLKFQESDEYKHVCTFNWWHNVPDDYFNWWKFCGKDKCVYGMVVPLCYFELMISG